ncbi:MAG: RNA polymerase factor sigma-32 [Polyangiaceae bacterium]|nr:RNA polymerase factor sigma-32 [Polyangiaceae bacterium]
MAPRQHDSNPKRSGRRPSRAEHVHDSGATFDSTRPADDDENDRPTDDDDDDEVVEVSAEIVDAEEPDPSTSIPASTDNSPSSAITHFDPLQVYLREVQRHPLLTPDDEHALAVSYAETGDVEAAAKLVSSNLRLVVKIAYEYRRAYRNIMDLIQEGNIGLMQAVKRYDPYRGVKLSSYAAWWIRAYILRFVLNNWRLVKLGTTQAQRKLFFNLNKEKARLSSMGIEPSSAEIAKRLNVNEHEVVEMDRRLAAREASLDAPVGDTDGRPVSRVEMLPAMGAGPDVALADGQFNALVRDRMGAFRQTLKSVKDIAIFDERLMADDPLTLQELGTRFGISRERVRQLEARLMSRLREFLKAELGEAIEAR